MRTTAAERTAYSSGLLATLAVAWTFAAIGLTLSYYAAAMYVPLARRALREGRGGQEALT